MNVIATPDGHEIMERVITVGDLALLTPAERNAYYLSTCTSLGLNPLTRPFDYLKLNGRVVLYARKDATDQLRKINGISLRILEQKTENGLFVVTVEARDKEGRVDTDIGAVAIQNLQGEARANAILKTVTKGKRRVTLSICGLGLLDETETSDIPASERQAWAESEPDAPPVETKPEPSPVLASRPASLIEVKPEPSPASTLAQTPATVEPPPMQTVVKILSLDGRAVYTGSIASEALTAYGKAKKRSTDAGAVAVANVDALKAVLPYVKNGWHKALKQEIEAAEALIDTLEHERLAAIDDNEVDEDGVVLNHASDDGEPGLAAMGPDEPGPA
jgi:hypothetical protein